MMKLWYSIPFFLALLCIVSNHATGESNAIPSFKLPTFPQEDAPPAEDSPSHFPNTPSSLSLDSARVPPWKRGANGGFQCATCVILIGLAERWSVVNNESVSDNLVKFCHLVPQKVKSWFLST